MGVFNFLKKDDSNKHQRKSTRGELFEEAMKQFETNKFADDEQAKAALFDAYIASKNDVFDRFEWYNAAVEYYYVLSSTTGDAPIEKCKELSEESIKFAPKVIEKYKKEYHGDSLLGFIPPEVPAFKYLAVIYEQEGNYAKAIKVCDKALEMDIRDGTVGGFTARKERLLQKKKKKK
ncbi:tetratricopeptide repeat protein [Alkalicoccus halolimnae]|uniref:Tetratricopeptide repeat protein n=1 Tax=Alkalicoccus halolimnae TaxID=1667239 RepID=A0A5C7F604_9BACI|nr:tetratricopeptide repeat protein [Alkalicoccus halolimnae]TXF86151.1 tetratricopeptide repeat protein [Alkalicoccus halolimnae]